KNCLNVTSYTSHADGTPAGNVNFTFPAKGTFTGDFVAYNTGDMSMPMLYTASGATSELNFRSAMLPAASITGGIGQATGSAPGSGVLTATGTTPHLVLSSTLPNHTFQVAVCWVSTDRCRALGNITTDAQGSASADVGTLQN